MRSWYLGGRTSEAVFGRTKIISEFKRRFVLPMSLFIPEICIIYGKTRTKKVHTLIFERCYFEDALRLNDTYERFEVVDCKYKKGWTVLGKLSESERAGA